MLKVMKALAEMHDLSLGDLLEGIILHAFEGRAPFGRRRYSENRSAESGLWPRFGLFCGPPFHRGPGP